MLGKKLDMSVRYTKRDCRWAAALDLISRPPRDTAMAVDRGLQFLEQYSGVEFGLEPPEGTADTKTVRSFRAPVGSIRSSSR